MALHIGKLLFLSDRSHVPTTVGESEVGDAKNLLLAKTSFCGRFGCCCHIKILYIYDRYSRTPDDHLHHRQNLVSSINLTANFKQVQ